MKKSVLNKIFLVFALLINLITVKAQINSSVDSSPNLTDNHGSGINSEKSLWDIQFNYNATTATSGDMGMAAVHFYNNEFWVSRFGSDTSYRFSSSGVLISEFTIPGLTGVRSFTSDANYIYASTNTNSIYRIDPVTHTLSGAAIAIDAWINVRFCTYDASLDGGNGGFWIGNFSTDILSIDMNGNTLSTITAATHGLTNMYGGAVDNFTAGGPYLWIFDQSGANDTQLIQLQLPGGTQTGLTHDVFADISVAHSLTSSLAGGAFISDQIVPGEVTLGGVAQGMPSIVLFGYELSAPPVGADMSVNSIRPVLGYTQVPLSQLTPDSLMIEIENLSATVVDSVIVTIEIEHSSIVVHSEQQVLLNYPAYGTSTIYSSAYLPASGLGDYVITVKTSTNITEPDPVSANDTAMFTLTVTDSVYARDNNVPDGGSGYVVSNSDWGYAVSAFHIFNTVTVSGIWIELATPVTGDTTFGVIVNMAGGIPSGVPNTTPIQIINSGQSTYYLQFPVGLVLNPGDYAFGCYEVATGGINLAQSTNVYTAGTNFHYTPTAGWSASGTQRARFIRPIFQASPAGVDESNPLALLVYPNPSNGLFNVSIPNSDFSHYQIMDITGKIIRNGSLQNNQSNIDITSCSNGIYMLQIIQNGIIVAKEYLVKN